MLHPPICYILTETCKITASSVPLHAYSVTSNIQQLPNSNNTVTEDLSLLGHNAILTAQWLWIFEGSQCLQIQCQTVCSYEMSVIIYQLKVSHHKRLLIFINTAVITSKPASLSQLHVKFCSVYWFIMLSLSQTT